MDLVNTHALENGDTVDSHGCLFRLKNKKVFRDACDLVYCDQGTVVFETDLLHYQPGSMPRRWAETWTIQGNGRAMWHRVASDVQ